MISILILVKNEAADVAACLDLVFPQQPGIAYEVIVIDSGSTDETLEKVRQFPVRLHQIRSEQFHHARTRNLAAGLSRGKYLVYLAGDAQPASTTWLSALIGNFSDPGVGAVYGRHLPKPGPRMERRAALGTLYGESRTVKSPGDGAVLGYRYYHFSTVNAAIRKDVWEVTKFPEDLKVFEDVGIAKRILDSGWRIVYEPEAAVYHSHDYPARILFKRYFDIGVVYQHLSIWDGNSQRSVRRGGWSAVRRKLFSIRQGESLPEVCVSLLCDAAKYAGIVLGRNEC